ncbi:DUF1360 domain-containing protein [Nocardioides massiliensis]|uniref:DUF1360 domain-containing protein n=1 Tax=Nocardioides massiliensis TaxID=1325935 RepID=A0ABT9NU91_9ACTN|nr:DUF1360 domain-containing protein [Nocardioides massiliensis]MDP9823984.1 hypothetical protein [Nocardioides massiliensis]
MRASRTDALADLVVDALATYRLVKLIRDDKITEPARDAVVDKHGPPAKSKVSYLVHCPWCLSFYFGAALTLGRRFAPGPTNGVSRTFALSALAGIGTQLLDS